MIKERKPSHHVREQHTGRAFQFHLKLSVLRPVPPMKQMIIIFLMDTVLFLVTGFCIVKRCNMETFTCKDGKTKIDACEQCDCVANCPDSSDEASCAPTLVDVTGKATGLLSSAANHQGNMSNVFCNSWKLQTNDRGFYIKLLFKKFSMSPNCMQNYVSLENAHFTDPTRTAECCKSLDSAVCRFGGTTSPPLSRTSTNWMTVKFLSETRESRFIAVWYNVNGLYPNGSIPSQDLTYAPIIELPTTKKNSPPSVTEPILAFILFALLLFALGSFIACKLGKRFIGPSCSFRHFIACVLRRPTPREAPSPSLSSEYRGLTAGIDDISLTGEESVRVTPGSLQAAYLGAYSDDEFRQGSTENII